SSDFHDLTEGFVTQNKIIGADRRSAIDKGANLFISATNADFESANLHFIVSGDLWGMMFDQTDLFPAGDHPYGLHCFLHGRRFRKPQVVALTITAERNRSAWYS